MAQGVVIRFEIIDRTRGTFRIVLTQGSRRVVVDTFNYPTMLWAAKRLTSNDWYGNPI